ncbi:Probable DNA endonuclease SmrA [Leclercia adecarboxylata]|uniref:Probable DNA endonuclease SmrA n=1 Tax=Leclercia adecarboxylata TaxID=83655 RepID=A0A4U9HUF7_9ENTR|nr:Probable DNA endonuclease SmrA [Leclercia adecarboxylata]
MNPEDKSLFLDAMEDVQRSDAVPTSTGSPPQPRAPASLWTPASWITFSPPAFLDVIPLAEPLAFRREGVQLGVIDKLRLGKYPRQASLTLLRQPVEQCRQQLYTFIRQAERDGLRNLIIIHGKGRDDKSHANIVRSYLARWLTEFEAVQAFCVAQPHHGGSGACYVALRKSSEAKLETRERLAKRSR